MFEVVDDAFAVKKVHGGSQKVPIERSCEGQVLRSARYVGNGNDFLERDDLNGRHYPDHIDVTGEHGAKKSADHYESPYRPGDESLLLLVIIGLGFRVFL